MTEYLLYTIVGLINITFFIFYFVYNKSKYKQKEKLFKEEILNLKNNISLMSKEKELIETNQIENQTKQLEFFEKELKHKEKECEDKLLIEQNKNIAEINSIKSQYENKIKELNLIMENKIKVIISDFEKQQQSLTDKINFIEESKKDMLLHFKELSEKIATQQSETNSQKISQIIEPFKKQMNELKSQVETAYISETKDRSMLQQELKSLKEMNYKMNEQTEKLSRVLKGDNKLLGNWGELVLETILENSGLRKDIEFKREVSLKDNEGNVFRPDVIVYLPDNREVIVDAKSSLSAYEKYINTNDKRFLNEHINSIKNHIKELSNKKYEKLKGINSLNFVFMFVPIESALSIALQEDKELFERAYKNNIFLVSPSTLLMSLKTIENIWKNKRQEDNVMKIVNKAGSMYDKFVGFVNDIEKIGNQLETVTKTYEEAKGKLYNGRGNLISQINQLKELGINNTKNIKDK